MIDPSEYGRNLANRGVLKTTLGMKAWKSGSRMVRNLKRQEIQRIALEAIDGFGDQGWDHVRVMFERARKTSDAFVDWNAEKSPHDYAIDALTRRGFIEARDDGPRLTALGAEALRDEQLLRRGSGQAP